MKRLIVIGALCLASAGLLHTKTCLVRSPHIDQQEETIYIDPVLKDAWKDSFITDTNFKVGICCTPLYGKSLIKESSLNIESFFPLSLLQHVSLYSLDSLESFSIPETMKIFHVEPYVKRSLTDLMAIVDQMNLVITTDPTVAYLATNLHKKTWLIVPETTDLEEITEEHPQLDLFVHTSDHELLFNIMHKLAYTIEQPTAEIVMTEVQIGELIDKMTILEIKTERITDENKLKNVWKELNSLRSTFDEFFVMTPELEQLIKQLKTANEALWETEDLIRDKEREKCFDDGFVALARSVYIQNDERCYFKRKINELLGSRLMEEKSYKPYN
jgi:hypothetical protein